MYYFDNFPVMIQGAYTKMPATKKTRWGIFLSIFLVQEVISVQEVIYKRLYTRGYVTGYRQELPELLLFIWKRTDHADFHIHGYILIGHFRFASFWQFLKPIVSTVMKLW